MLRHCFPVLFWHDSPQCCGRIPYSKLSVILPPAHSCGTIGSGKVEVLRLRCCCNTWFLPSPHTNSESKLLLSCHILKAPDSNLEWHPSLRKKTAKEDFQTKWLKTQEKHIGNEAVVVLVQTAIPLLEATGYGVEMPLVNAGRGIPNLRGLSVQFTSMIWTKVQIFGRNPVFSCFWTWKF